MLYGGENSTAVHKTYKEAVMHNATTTTTHNAPDRRTTDHEIRTMPAETFGAYIQWLQCQGKTREVLRAFKVRFDNSV